MTNIFSDSFRISDILCDRVLNPARDTDLGNVEPRNLIEACGILPDFFCQSIITTKQEGTPLTLLAVAMGMDKEYQHGGFTKYPFKGYVHMSGDKIGVYETDDDPDMKPLARFAMDRFFCYVYEYGICAIVDTDVPSKYKNYPSQYIARFD